MTDVLTRKPPEAALASQASQALREQCHVALVKLDELSARLAQISISQPDSPVIPLLRQSIAHLQTAAKALEKGTLS